MSAFSDICIAWSGCLRRFVAFLRSRARCDRISIFSVSFLLRFAHSAISRILHVIIKPRWFLPIINDGTFHFRVALIRLESVLLAPAASRAPSPRAAWIIQMMSVDPHNACFDLVCYSVSLREIVSPNRRSQSKSRLVCNFDDVLLVLAVDDRDNGSEDLVTAKITARSGLD